MNKKQLISMWCGIVVVVLHRYWHIGYWVEVTADALESYFVTVFIIALITAALIYTFRNKKGE